MRVGTSPEAKAVSTAAPLARALDLDLHFDGDLREVGRGPTPILERGAYVALAGRYLRGEPIDGWEPAADARARFGAAVASTARRPTETWRSSGTAW